MDQNSHTTIQKHLETMLALMGFSFEIEVKRDEEKKEALFHIRVQEGQPYLIGRQGANLEALQQLIKSLQHKVKDGFRYSVDVNNYLEEKKKHVQERVEQLMKEESAKNEILLWPMSSFERKAVHELFVGDDRFHTESVGAGKERRITIRKTQ